MDDEPVFVDPSSVVGIQRRQGLGRFSRVDRAGNAPVYVRGTPREVATTICAKDDTLSRVTVVEALTLEYRMAHDSGGDAPEDKRRLLSIRVALRNLAQRMGVVLDETLINTPLKEGT